MKKMKQLSIATILLLSMASGQTKSQGHLSNNHNKTEVETKEKTAIEKLLYSYRDALNASDINKVLTLYTAHGVFMPSNARTSVGQEQVKGAYEFVFKNIKINIEFSIDEIVLSGDYAFVRTTSKGTSLIHATGQTVTEENRELFVLQKEKGTWKIARYMFNKAK
jgi:uncharacterized protein (TIGR02246 family)